MLLRALIVSLGYQWFHHWVHFFILGINPFHLFSFYNRAPPWVKQTCQVISSKCCGNQKTKSTNKKHWLFLMKVRSGNYNYNGLNVMWYFAIKCNVQIVDFIWTRKKQAIPLKNLVVLCVLVWKNEISKKIFGGTLGVRSVYSKT